MSSIWSFITDFGDTAVTVPLAVLMLCFLLVMREWRLALVWAVAIVGCAGVIGGLKLVLGACSSSIGTAGLASPSGHTAMSAVVYGGFAAIVGANLAPAARTALISGVVALIVTMPLSRVVLHAHTSSEVVIGLAVGLPATAIIILATLAIRREQLPLARLVAAAIALLLLLHGERWPAEREIHRFAIWLGLLRRLCG